MPRQNLNFNHDIVLKAEEEFHKLKEGKLAIQLRAIMAFEDNTAEHIAKIFKVSIRTIFRWIHRFSKYGIEGLKDQPKGHNKPKLTEDQKQQLKTWIINGKNSNDELIHWTLEKLKAEVEKIFGVKMSTMALWKNLKKLGLTLKKPRPIHHKADKEAQNIFKKNF